jgi:hypothetical protein
MATPSSAMRHDGTLLLCMLHSSNCILLLCVIGMSYVLVLIMRNTNLTEKFLAETVTFITMAELKTLAMQLSSAVSVLSSEHASPFTAEELAWFKHPL